MRIATLTFHRACNYGGVLQCFALVKSIRSMGYDAEVADYRNPVIERTYALITTSSIKGFIASLLVLPYSIRKKRKFRSFVKKYIPISDKVFKSASELSNQYDFCFIGSDQVWSKRINKGFDPAYWGLFDGKKATYAVSMGTDHNFSEQEYDKIKSYLCNFDFISTREDSLRDELKDLTNKPIQTVIDPTLLLTNEDYKEIAIKPDEDNYILFYQMMYHPKSKDFVANIARQLRCKVITIMGPKEQYEGVEYVYKSVSQVSVEEFVGYIYYAKCVIASSFHGTALPIAMRKDFYFLANSMTDRSANLLRYLGALDRMKKATDFVNFKSVDYSRIEGLLADFIKTSKKYINSVIQN